MNGPVYPSSPTVWLNVTKNAVRSVNLDFAPDWSTLGVALFSTGSVWSEAEPDTSGPANTTDCVFERNIATEGGGVYSAAGFDIIRGCSFETNFAGLSV